MIDNRLMRPGLLRAAPAWAHAQGRLRFQCEDSFVESWMALSKLFVAVKKSIFSKRFHYPHLRFHVRRLRIVDNGFSVETTMNTGRLPTGKMANRACRID